MLSNAKPNSQARTTIPRNDGDDGDESHKDAIDLSRIEGRMKAQNLKASSVKKVGEIVEKHPDEALSIVRNWLHQKG